MVKSKSVVISVAFLFAACGRQSSPYASDPGEIIRLDSLMNVLAQTEGFHRALLHYASDDFVKFDEGQLPALGKHAYEERTSGKPGTTALQWRPLRAEVAQSGELGYTWGNWTLKGVDTVYHGNYFSVWKRNSKGEWRLALDGGNTTPPH